MSPVAPYGSWVSPITAEAVAAQSLFAGVEEIIIDPLTSKVYFAQKRPEENGRAAIVDASDRQDLFDGSWDARTQLHEYGGGASTVFGDVLYFSHILDHRVYKTTKGGTPTPVTPRHQPRLAFCRLHRASNTPDLIVCSVEDHTDPHPARVETYLILINAEKGSVSKLMQGADFYACARFSPDGNFLAWQQWNHPELPWQSAEIKVAPVTVSSGGTTLELGTVTHIAGKTEAIAAQDPNWASNDTIFFTCDVSGYHNPWKFTFSGDLAQGTASPILMEPMAEEFGAPQWWLSRHGCAALSANTAVFVAFRNGRSVLYVCDLASGQLTEVRTPYAHIQYLHGDRRGKVVMLGQPADAGEVLMELTLDTQGRPRLRALRTCHVTYYAPRNPNYDGGLLGEAPPVVVLIHGGPFYMETGHLDWSKQFFTSRGWAYLDVNYAGSTGFGRAFRESLHGQWGVLDIADAHESVLALQARGLVDARRAVVHGGSAGGYAVLQLATTRPDAFAAGAPQYGISDMRALDEVLHKFEYYLCDRLMGGPWETCERVWRERSPIYHADKIRMPLLILQGEKDTIVPADQMINMVETIKARGGKVDLVLFPDEGHGWRQASTVQTVLEKELMFFNEVLGLENTY
ncbi:Alpha/Beta hydrolase protein [Mycena sp. CBHHK59/15]|nr:Alpha/Beta hydrolase protein [Mycena sp. CBHHK59/15]